MQTWQHMQLLSVCQILLPETWVDRSVLCGFLIEIRIMKMQQKVDHCDSFTPERKRYNVLCRQRTGSALGYSRDTKNSKVHKLHDR